MTGGKGRLVREWIAHGERMIRERMSSGIGEQAMGEQILDNHWEWMTSGEWMSSGQRCPVEESMGG